MGAKIDKIRRPSACQNLHWGRFTFPLPPPDWLGPDGCWRFGETQSAARRLQDGLGASQEKTNEKCVHILIFHKKN